MKKTSDIPAPNPDQFARDLHKALLLEGPRSSAVRGLMRIARKNPGAELERIFETKVAEYKRHHRETRVPTWRNAPQRAIEWLTENASFTPPKDVMMTLVYVVLALLGVEFSKGFLGYDQSNAGDRPVDSRWGGQGLFEDSSVNYGVSSSTNSEVGNDALLWQQMEAEQQAASRSEELSTQVKSMLSDVKLDEMLKQEVSSVNLKEELNSQLTRILDSNEFRQQMKDAMSEIAKDSDSLTKTPADRLRNRVRIEVDLAAEKSGLKQRLASVDKSDSGVSSDVSQQLIQEVQTIVTPQEAARISTPSEGVTEAPSILQEVIVEEVHYYVESRCGRQCIPVTTTRVVSTPSSVVTKAEPQSAGDSSEAPVTLPNPGTP